MLCFVDSCRSLTHWLLKIFTIMRSVLNATRIRKIKTIVVWIAVAWGPFVKEAFIIRIMTKETFSWKFACNARISIFHNLLNLRRTCKNWLILKITWFYKHSKTTGQWIWWHSRISRKPRFKPGVLRTGKGKVCS